MDKYQDKLQRYHMFATVVEGYASLGQNDIESAEILNEIIKAAKVELAKVTNGNEPTAPNSVQPELRTIANGLNDICDQLSEIRSMTKFLSVAVTNLDSDYSDDIRHGGELCFEQIDRRIVETLGNIETITTEVKQHEYYS